MDRRRRSIYAYKRVLIPRAFSSRHPSGKRELWKELTRPTRPHSNVASPAIAADGKTYAYSYNRILSDMFLVEGMK